MELRAARSGPIAGVAPIPGDKSCSHRALILGALAEGETRISGLLESEDVSATVTALQAFGIRVDRRADCWTVEGGAWRSPDIPIDCRNSGTTARLLIGAAAGFPLSATFTGDRSLSSRPMRRVTEPLARMGAIFVGGERLPLTLHGGGLSGICHRNVPASAQVKSAILLAGLNAAGEVTVDEPVPSRNHTEIMLRHFGCEVREDGGTIRLGAKRRLAGRAVRIPADTSSAAFAWLAAAIVPGSDVIVEDVLLSPRRNGILVALQRMGGTVEMANAGFRDGEGVGDIRVRHAPLSGQAFGADMVPAMIDEIPVLAVAAAFAEGETVIEGLAELRHKESDRLAGIVSGLTACGVAARAEGDALRVVGRPRVPGGGRVKTNGDHRIAMAFAVLGLAAEEPIVVDGAEMIATSFPGFVETMRALGADMG